MLRKVNKPNVPLEADEETVIIHDHVFRTHRRTNQDNDEASEFYEHDETADEWYQFVS